MYPICLVFVAEQWSWIKVEILFSLWRLLFNSIFRTTPFPSLQSPCLQMVPGVPDYCWFNSSCRGDSVGLTMRNGVGNLELWCFCEDFKPVFLFSHCYPCIQRAPHNSLVFQVYAIRLGLLLAHPCSLHFPIKCLVWSFCVLYCVSIFHFPKFCWLVSFILLDLTDLCL